MAGFIHLYNYFEIFLLNITILKDRFHKIDLFQ